MVEACRGGSCGSTTAKNLTINSPRTSEHGPLHDAVDKDANHLESEMKPDCSPDKGGAGCCGPSRNVCCDSTSQEISSSEDWNGDSCAGKDCCVGSIPEEEATTAGLTTQQPSGCCSGVDEDVKEMPTSGCCDGCEGSDIHEELDDACCSKGQTAATGPLDGEADKACEIAKAVNSCASTPAEPICSPKTAPCCKPADPLTAIEKSVVGCASSRVETCSPSSKIASEPAVPEAKGCCSKQSDTPLEPEHEESAVVGSGCCSSATKTCSASNVRSTAPVESSGCCSKATAAPLNNIEEDTEHEVDDCCNPSSAGCPPPRTILEAPPGPKAKGCCSSSARTERSSDSTGDGCCSSGVRQRRATSKVTPVDSSSGKKGQATRRVIQQEPMCPCCVESMLKSNLNVLDILMSRVAEAQSKFKRCCIAFADMCCAKSRTAAGCCESSCDGTSEKSPLLQKVSTSESAHENRRDQKTEVDLVATLPATQTEVKDDIVLEVIGMDCPDCLSKVTRAVQILSGAEVTNADGVRGLVGVRYDPNRIDLKAIQTFAARASGFTINVLDAAPQDAGKILLIPLTFDRMPPASVLEAYEVLTSTNSSAFHKWSTGARKVSKRLLKFSSTGVDVDLILRPNSTDHLKPRDILKDLAPYGVTLRRHRDDQNHKRINRDLINISLRTLASLVLTIPILVLVWSPTPLVSNTTSLSVQLALATLIIIVAWPVYSGSFRSAYYLHRADLGVLTSFSTLTSYIFSVVAFGFEMAGREIGEPFFETVGLLITLIFAGRTLQASTRKLGLQAVGNLGRLQPEHARWVRADAEDAQIDVRLLHYDDVIRVNDGEIIPTDGIVIRGQGTVDESSLTGESMPVPKSRGSTMTAGTTLTHGSIDMIVTHLVPENSISTIMDAVSSSSTGSEYQDLADRMAGWLLPIAGVCCLAALIGWMLVERLRRGQGWGEAVISGVGYAIAIAAVSCPCALAIAVTLVTSISMATTVNEGVLFRSVQALLTAHSVKAIAFDKTGTLSQGVMAIHQTSYDPDPLSLRLIHRITASNKHPVSETARRYLESQHSELKDTLLSGPSELPEAELGDIELIPGKGVSANFFGFDIRAGNATFTHTESHPLVKEYLSNGMTILVITLGQQLIGLFGMKDQPRPGVDRLISDLGREGRQISLVSGDNPSAVHAFACEVGIDHLSVHASQTPTSKAEVVKSLKQACASGKVAFVGDGINDIIALSTADISIATGSASNASSQIIILSNDVPKAIRSLLATSYLTRNHVVASLAFCGVYFTVAILLASGVTGWRIPPAYAGLGELVSILPVLLVGAHLALFKAITRKSAAAAAAAASGAA